MAMAVVLVLLVVGSLLFHYLSPWYFTPDRVQLGDDRRHRFDHVLGDRVRLRRRQPVHGVLRAALSEREDEDARTTSPRTRSSRAGSSLLTSVGVAAMLTPGLFAWAKFVDVPKDAAVVEVVGRSGTSTYRFPGEDGVLGTVDARFVTDANPVRHQSRRPARARRRPGRDPGAASSRRQADQDGAALDRRAARLHRAAVPRRR